MFSRLRLQRRASQRQALRSSPRPMMRVRRTASNRRTGMKLRTDQVGRAGEFFVAAEIHRRGGYAVTFAGNMPGIDILASDVSYTRQVTIQVKTRTAGSWHAQVPRDAEQGPPVPDE